MTLNPSADMFTGIPEDERLVVEGLTMTGCVNVEHDQVYENIRYAIRQQHPQVWNQTPHNELACIVCGGASLDDTEDELVDLWHQGAKVFTVNGSYQWCLDRNIKPYAQVIIDARPENARFLSPDRPNVRYLLASQCAKESWDAVADRELVGIWHAVDDGDPAKAILDDYYLKNWQPIQGGTTVGTRCIGLCRVLGFVRMHIFGMDCCYLNGKGHAYPMPENEIDMRLQMSFQPGDRVDLKRTFEITPWHIKHLEDTLRFIKHGGDYFVLNVHGDGLLAYALSTNATPTEE